MRVNISFFATILIIVLHYIECRSHEGEDDAEEIRISSKCAAVLLTAGAMFGSGMAYAVTPAALCTAGFCPVGVTGGSFASFWQSTMPLVSSGSGFASLQSIAMGGSGTGTIMLGGAMGGAVAANYLKQFCAFVDETDSDSFMGKTFENSLLLVTTIINKKKEIEVDCASSQTCTALLEGASKSAKAFVTSASQAKEMVKNECASSQTCMDLLADVSTTAEVAYATASAGMKKATEVVAKEYQELKAECAASQTCMDLLADVSTTAEVAYSAASAGMKKAAEAVAKESQELKSKCAASQTCVDLLADVSITAEVAYATASAGIEKAAEVVAKEYQELKTECATSQTCSDMVDKVMETTEVLWTSWNNFKSSISEGGLKDEEEGNEKKKN